jgi:hypothetical protein
MGVGFAWSRKFARNLFIETWFELRPDGCNQFGSVDYFAWPYLVTAEQKEAIKKSLLAPRASVMAPASVVTASGFFLLKLQWAILLGLCVFLILRQWPRVWAGIILADCPRLEKVKVGKRSDEASQLSKGVGTGATLLLAGTGCMLIAVLEAYVAWDGLERRGPYFFGGIFGFLFFSYLGVSAFLNWVYRPRVPPLREPFNAYTHAGTGWRLDSEAGEGGDGGGDGGGD